MHELWLCNNILDIVRQRVVDTQYTQIKTIILEIGKLTAIEKTSLNFSFDVIKLGTVAENATLEIIDIEAKAFCDVCQIEAIIHQYYEPCPKCGGQLRIINGEELRVKSIEVK